MIRTHIAMPARLATIALPICVAAVTGCAPETAGPSSGRAARSSPERVEFTAIADALVRGENKYLGRRQVEKVEARLGDPGLSLRDRLAGLVELAGHHLRLGNVEAGVATAEQATLLANEVEDREAAAEALFQLGTAYLRRAEVQNCIVRHNRDCCIVRRWPAEASTPSRSRPGGRARRSRSTGSSVREICACPGC